MPVEQLDITGSFDKQALDERKQRISELRSRTEAIIQEWWDTFGNGDTPVPADRAWHNLTIALDSIQEEQQYRDRVAMAEEQLEQSEWILNTEQQ